MKKVLPVVLMSVAILGGAGCVSTQSGDDVIDTIPVEEDVTVIPNSQNQKAMPNSPQKKFKQLMLKLLLSKFQILRFQLPMLLSPKEN